MKKIILLTTVFFILSNCEITTRKTNANDRNIKYKKDKVVSSPTHYMLGPYLGNGDYIEYSKFTREGMDYVVIHQDYREGGLAIINVTKDKLEVEALKLQIKRLKNQTKNL